MPPRGKNFTNKEDKGLCVAYVKTSKDTINGTDQSGEVLWNSVFEEFVKVVPDHSSRDCTKLSKRWYKIQPLVGKFSSVYGRVKRELGSGHTDCDVLNEALNHWKRENNDKAFPLLHCWELLRLEDKFNPVFMDPLKVVGSTEEMIRVTEKASTDRPQGKKRVLKQARDDKVKIHIAEQMKQLNDILAERSEVALFSAIDDEISREFFKWKRQRVLDRMRKECGERVGRIEQHRAAPGIDYESVQKENQLLPNEVITNIQQQMVEQFRRQQEEIDHPVSE